MELDDKYIDGNIPQGWQYVQATLDSFVAVNYDITYDALHGHPNSSNIDYLREQIVKILRSNPPLATVPKYLNDGRPNYLWYSDFYDNTTKDVIRQYGRFVASDTKITPANYAVELDKIDLPYFKELVNLVSLEKLYTEAVNREIVAKSKPAIEDTAEHNDSAASTQDEPPKQKRLLNKRTYEPRLSNEQYSILAECVENMKLFCRQVKVSELKLLLKGKLGEPLQVANQNSLTYLLDKLGEDGYIKNRWPAIAVGNKDFLSFRRGKNVDRYGDEPHYITMQQFSNCRQSNKKVGLKDFIPIEEVMDKIRECMDK